MAIPQLALADQTALARAVVRLERSSLALRLADYAGQPIHRIINVLPPAANDIVRSAVHLTMMRCLRLAIKSLEERPLKPPSLIGPKVVSSLTGGVSGLIGLAALPIELPVTTTNILRAIAEIARSEGENLADRRTQIACLEVFALGRHGNGLGSEAGYYALRTMLARFTGEAVSYLVQRGVAEETAPVLMRLVTEVATRYGFVVSERAAASAVPVIGALGGAMINWIFMDYFQDVARGHFAVRRLERTYGAEPIRALYQEVARRLAAKRRRAR